MTIASSLGRVVSTGNGSTVDFSFNAPVLDQDHLSVYTYVIATGVQTLQTRGGAGTYDYTVAINASTKFATITVNTALPSTHRIVILRDVPLTQETDYVEGDPFAAQTHEEALDKLTMAMTQISEVSDRSVKVIESSATSNITLAELVADRVIVANSSADGLAMGPTTTDLTVLAAITADIQTVAGISSDVTTVAADGTDIGIVATNIASVNTVAAVDTQISLLGTTDAIADMNTLGTAAIVADLDAVADKVTEIGRLGTADAVADLATLGTADVVSDMNTLATAAIVADMAALADVTTEMGLLGTADAVADMNTLGTADVVADMNTLATAATVADMAALADVTTDIGTLADIEDGTVATTAISSLAALSTEIQALYAQLATIATKVSTTGDTMTGDLILNTTGALTLPVGTQAQRPTPVKGMFRFNDDSDAFEGYDGAAWGAVGGGNTAVVGWENQITVAEDYTITTGNNMMSAGPVTIDTGFTVTVPTGSRWVVV